MPHQPHRSPTALKADKLAIRSCMSHHINNIYAEIKVSIGGNIAMPKEQENTYSLLKVAEKLADFLI